MRIRHTRFRIGSRYPDDRNNLTLFLHYVWQLTVPHLALRYVV